MTEDHGAIMPSASPDAHRIEPEAGEEGAPKVKPRNRLRSRRLPLQSTGSRPSEEESKEQIKALKSKSQMGEGPAVRTVYEQVQQESIET